MLGAWMVMKWPVLLVSTMQDDVNIVKGACAIVDGEETETLGVMVAETSSVIVAVDPLS